MNLVKKFWNIEDGAKFEEYLQKFSKGKEKSQWEKRILNTGLDCIAVPANEVKRITNEISKGNFISFLDLWLWNNWTESSINGGLICKIKDFNLFKIYLDKYAGFADNWATCDLLKFPIKKANKEEFFNLAEEYIKSPLPFKRRIGISILFKLVDDDNYIFNIFNILNTFENEEEYYVNMINAWLVAECFIKQRNKTLDFLSNNRLNKFTINKAISKCRDSFRVDDDDKEMLIKFRKK